jgi:hypothetical protein
VTIQLQQHEPNNETNNSVCSNETAASIVDVVHNDTKDSSLDDVVHDATNSKVSSNESSSSFVDVVHNETNNKVCRDVHVVTHIWAEMGNWLFFSIMGKCLQLKLQDAYGIESRLILKRPDIWSKGMLQAQNTLQRCFPFYRILSEISTDAESNAISSSNSSVIVEEYHILPAESSKTIEQKLQKLQQTVTRTTNRIIIKLYILSFLVSDDWLDNYFDAL